MQLTFGETNDGGAIALADDGTIYFVFGSKRAGNVDIWMKSSKDGVNWSDPWPAVQTPIEDLAGCIERTSDGRYHLTGRRGFAVWDSSSSDLVNWTEPARWTEPGTTGYFQEAPNGDYWLVTIAGRSGNHDLYIQRSGDKGKTWTDPVAITSDPLEDYLFAFRIASDGTLVLLWERHDASVSGGPLGRSTDIYLSTSADGIDWTDPELLTPESDEPKNVDTIPSLLEGPNGQIYAVWLTTRVVLTKPTVVGVPVWPRQDLSDVRRIPAEGYAVCGQTLSDGRYMLAWVGKVSGSKGGHDNFYRILDDFNFEGFDPVLPPTP